MMNRHYLIYALLLLPSLAGAEWVLQQSDTGHWISIRNNQQHQLIISEQANEKQILLVLSLTNKYQQPPTSAKFSVDENTATEYPLSLLKQGSSGPALQLVFDDVEKDHFIAQLVAGLDLRVDFGEQGVSHFSLNGFTSAFSDFLIASDIGQLDPYWLQIQGKKKELTCYEISLAMVHTMAARYRGQTAAEVYSSLSGQMSSELETALPDIIEQAYSFPLSDLPRIPSTKKYEFFKRCMQKMK